MFGEMTPLRIVSTAEELIGIRDGGDASLWPKQRRCSGARLFFSILVVALASGVHAHE